MKYSLYLLFSLFVFLSPSAWAAGEAADPAAVAAHEAEDIQKQADMMVKQLQSLQGLPPPDERTPPAPAAQPAAPAAHPGSPGAQPAATAQAPIQSQGSIPCDASMFGAVVQGGSITLLQQKAAQLISDPNFMAAATSVWNNPNRPKVFGAQVAFFFFMVFVQIIHNSRREEEMFKRALHGLAFKVITWVGVIYAIPVFMLGSQYAVLLKYLKRFLFG